MKVRLALTLLLSAGFPLAAAAQAHDCVEKSTSKVEMGECLYKALQEADAELNQVFQAAIEQIRAADHMKPAERKSWDSALRDAQRKWIAFRDADCKKVIAFEWFGGTGAGNAAFACSLEATRLRVKDLMVRYAR